MTKINVASALMGLGTLPPRGRRLAKGLTLLTAAVLPLPWGGVLARVLTRLAGRNRSPSVAPWCRRLWKEKTMLREILPVRQVAGEPRRRWFSSATCDLIVWLDDKHVPVAFQLCYDKGSDEHALTWNRTGAYSHSAVDAGEQRAMRYKSAPLLVADGAFDAPHVAQLFAREGATLPREYAELVTRKIREHGRAAKHAG